MYFWILWGTSGYLKVLLDPICTHLVPFNTDHDQTRNAHVKNAHAWQSSPSVWSNLFKSFFLTSYVSSAVLYLHLWCSCLLKVYLTCVSFKCCEYIFQLESHFWVQLPQTQLAGRRPRDWETFEASHDGHNLHQLCRPALSHCKERCASGPPVCGIFSNLFKTYKMCRSEGMEQWSW